MVNLLKIVCVMGTVGIVAVGCGASIESAPSPIAEVQAPGLTGQDLFQGLRPLPVAAYYNPSVTQFGYTGAFDTARSRWSGVSSRVGTISRASSFGPQTDSYKVISDANDDSYGYVTGWQRSSSGDIQVLLDDRWDYAVLILNDATIRADFPSTVALEIRKTAIHELGHTLKLDHTTEVPEAQSIMAANVVASDIQVYDQNELRQKWGN